MADVNSHYLTENVTDADKGKANINNIIKHIPCPVVDNDNIDNITYNVPDSAEVNDTRINISLHVPDTDVGDDDSNDIAEHVETVCYQSHRVCCVAHYKMHNLCQNLNFNLFDRVLYLKVVTYISFKNVRFKFWRELL